MGMHVLGYDPYYTPNAKDGTDFIIPVSEEQLLQRIGRGVDSLSVEQFPRDA